MALRTLVRNGVRRILRTNDVTNYIRMKRWSLQKKIYFRPYGSAELRSALQDIGIRRGRVVWVQSSWNEFHSYQGKPTEVLEMLRELTGPEGTLVFPTYPINPDPNKVLMIDTAPSSTGLLTELFRRQPGIHRSIHLQSSVSAVGPMAEYLVKDHHRDIFTWGRLSPFWRLTECDALMVSLGNGHAIDRSTPLHCVECLLYDEIPYFQQILKGTVRYRWQRRNGETGEHEFYIRHGRINTRSFRKQFPGDVYRSRKLRNLIVSGADAKPTLEFAIALARKGITNYVDPPPHPSLFIPTRAQPPADAGT